MVEVKVETSPTFAVRDVGETFAGYPIQATTPDSPNMILNLPDGTDVAAVMRELQARNLVVDWRYAYRDYGVGPWEPQYGPLANSVGDTFGLMGLSEAVRRRGNYGAGVAILVCDTGVQASHEAFGGKSISGDLSDSHGHGTHVASTAGSGWGIASDAAIHSRAVLPGGQGSEAGIANGLRAAADWAMAQRVPAVCNLSLGGSQSSVLDDAVRYMQQRGIVVCAAAGNSSGAAIGSPARAADLIVLAVDRQRNYAQFTSGTNWSNANRVSAPGVDIVAANKDGGMLSNSGTSMACPHVAGCVALLLAAGYSRQEVLGHA